MGTKKYWKGLEDLNNDPSFIKSAQNEFAEEIPLDKFLGESSLENTSTPRRDFLKFLGFSVTAASLAACETPVRKVIPYVVKPEEVTPGLANWYASSFADGSEYCSIVVKSREGRPIKIEGNKLCPVTKGGTSARVQASVLSLYDSARLNGPTFKGEPTTWSKADADIKKRLEEISAAGGNIRILTSSVISPSTKQVFADFSAKYPNTKQVTYDAVSYAGILQANKAKFGKAVAPTYNFDKAKIIVSFGADFLATWLSPIEFATQYGVARKLRDGKKTMARHIQFETNLSITGGNADLRVPVKPSEMGAALLSLYKALGGSVTSKQLSFDSNIQETAKELMANKGNALVVCGSNDPNIQMVVNAINETLGSYGTTIDIENHSNLRQGTDTEVVDLLREMQEGKVDALFMYNVNPSYTLPAHLGFEIGLNKVKLKVSFADRIDETAWLADYVCPDHHYLESWGDANPKKGHYSIIQPVIYPIYATRSAQESLLTWSGNENTPYQSYVKAYWEKNIFPGSKESNFNNFWNKSLFDGVVITSGSAPEPATGKADASSTTKQTETSAEPAVAMTAGSMDLSSASDAILKVAVPNGAFELCLYEKVAIGNGSMANNPWLQELPDPISKVTWDNYVTMSPSDVAAMKLNLMERTDREADVIEVTVNKVTMKLPVYPSPGQTIGTIGIALGYGRTKAGKAANEVGQNAYQFVTYINSLNYTNFSVTVSQGSVGKHMLAATQTHHTMMGRAMVRETSLDAYTKNPKAGNDPVLIPVRDEHGHHVGKKPSEIDLWATPENPGHDKPGHFWGMAVDLNSCIGCSACTIACQAENNVPVVGKKEVMMSREMHWLRIDRYFTSDADPKPDASGISTKDYTAMETAANYPGVAFQPVMCVHCSHAPCETVCPVVATSHSSEGLNQMTYNRCVGTKYCANNCPYKVRRFNWFKYSDNAQFDFNMNDDLGKMVLNPDVVVRSRGVMEKCSMCVQRIQEGKLSAKKDGRKIVDGEIKTACAQACPTNAIVFGDFNNTESEVAKLNRDDRRYLLLEELNTQPSVFYMTKVRNTTEKEA